jgi:hypothetical protein
VTYEERARLAAQHVAEQAGIVVYVENDVMHGYIEFHIKNTDGPFLKVTPEFIEDAEPRALQTAVYQALRDVRPLKL